MFSSDLTKSEREARLGHMRDVPTAAFLSAADQFVPPGDARSPEALRVMFERTLFRASAEETAGDNKSLVRVIEGADHTLSDGLHAQEFVSAVAAFVADLND